MQETSRYDTETPASAPDAMESKAMELKWEGARNQVIGKAKELWGTLADSDLRAEGSAQDFIGRVQRHTGESLDSIRAKLFEDNEEK